VGKKIRIVIPKAPVVDAPEQSRRKAPKIRRSWTRNPAEQIVPNRKKDLQERRFSNKGNLRRQMEQELDDNETE
jgi:hypothetical protein